MPGKAQPLRPITGNEPDTFALTLPELAGLIAETVSCLRKKAINGRIPHAYRTNGSSGPWRFPMAGVRAYQKANSITIPK